MNCAADDDDDYEILFFDKHKLLLASYAFKWPWVCRWIIIIDPYSAINNQRIVRRFFVINPIEFVSSHLAHKKALRFGKKLLKIL